MREVFTFALAAIFLGACLPELAKGYDDRFDNEIIDEVLNANADSQRHQEYNDALDTLYDLGNPGFDPADLAACQGDDLATLEQKRVTDRAATARIRNLVEDMSGDQVFAFMMELNELNTDQIYKKFQIPGIETIDQQDALVVEFIIIAADRESVEALNEIGAANLYCYFGVEQNVGQAVEAFKEASDLGDPLAKMSLGKIYYQGLGEYHRPEIGKKLQDEAFEDYLQILRSSREKMFQEARTE